MRLVKLNRGSCYLTISSRVLELVRTWFVWLASRRFSIRTSLCIDLGGVGLVVIEVACLGLQTMSARCLLLFFWWRWRRVEVLVSRFFGSSGWSL